MKRILILGCGFAGLEAAVQARLLLGDQAEIKAVDRHVHQTYLPQLHEVLSGKLQRDDIQLPLLPIFKALGVDFLQGTVEGVDARNHRVQVGGVWVRYDFLIFALGSGGNYFGIPGGVEHSVPFKSLQDAQRIRERLTALAAHPRGSHPVVVVGGGLQGVEVAGEIMDALRSLVADEEARRRHLPVVLVEAQPRLLGNLPEEAGRLARQVLSEQGIRLCLGCRIVRVTAHQVHLATGKKLPFGLLIWAGGVRPPDLLRESGLAMDEKGWLAVDPYLRSKSHPSVYGVGDAISIGTGEGLLALEKRRASQALDQGGLAAMNVHASLLEQRPMRYLPRFRPVLFSLGEAAGVMVVGERIRSGTAILALKRRLLEVHWARYSVGLLARRLDACLPGYAARYFLRKVLAW